MSLQRENRKIFRQKERRDYEGRSPQGNRNRDEVMQPQTKEHPGWPADTRRGEEARKCSLEPQWSVACRHLDFGTLASGAVKEQLSFV